MPNSIPQKVTAEIEKYVHEYIRLQNLPVPLHDVEKLLIKAAQFGYSLGKAESTRDEHLADKNKKHERVI